MKMDADKDFVLQLGKVCYFDLKVYSVLVLYST